MAFDLSQHMSMSKLIRFTLPTIFMMIFTSLYTIVDGIFVSNFAGKTAFAAVNFILPFCMILASVGMMIGTGGSAIVAKRSERATIRAHAAISPYSLSLRVLSVRRSLLWASSSWKTWRAFSEQKERCLKQLPSTVSS